VHCQRESGRYSAQVQVVRGLEVLSSDAAEMRGDPCLEPNNASEGFRDLAPVILSDTRYVQSERRVEVIKVRLV
jgi:hypothetical protein